MVNSAGDTAKLLRNLADAGCAASLRTRLVQLRDEEKKDELLRLLRQHRRALLKKIHDNQKRIDCLDFLLFSMHEGGF